MAIQIGGTAMAGREGFHMTFKNGYTVSVQQHKHSYADAGDTAEVAAWDADGNWVRLRSIFDGDDIDSVIGWCDADKVGKIIDYVRMIKA